MRISDQAVLLSAALGPVAAGFAWLVLLRWRWARRTLAGTIWLVSHAAAWVVFWRLYGGTRIGWGGLEPSLLQASIVPVAELGVLFGLVRVETLTRRQAVGAVVALSVSTSAVVYSAFSGGLIAHALLLPVPTLAALAASLAGSERPGVAWFGGLAVADVLGVVGITVLFDQTGSSLLARTDGLQLGSGLLLLAAALKAGAIPGVATWRLTATGGPAVPVTAALRAQGMILAAVAGPTVAGFEESLPLAAAGAGAALLIGAAALLTVRADSTLASICGLGATTPFLALGLGGAVGVRAYLILFPVFLLASGVALLMGWSGEEEEAAGRRSRLRRWAGAVSLGVAAASLIGVPPAGGFPGTWMALQLAAARADAEPVYVVLAAAAAIGLAATAVATIPLLRAARPRALPALLASAAGGVLLYAGSLPVRIGAGWWVRVEREVGVPEVLSFSGAPDVPPVELASLLGAIASVAVPILAVILLGRGFRDAAGEFAPFIRRTSPERDGRVVALGRTLRRTADRFFIGLVLGSVMELAAIAVIVRLVVLAGRRGFL